MKARRPASPPTPKLRARAEQLLRRTRNDIAHMPVEDVQKLVHELQVHQIELEMQNDELRRTQLELETVRDRYADLYDFAPTAHLTMGSRGEILDANLHAGKLLGMARDRLPHQKFSHFVAPEAQDTFHLLYRQIFDADTRHTAELALVNGHGRRLFVQAVAVRDLLNPGKQCRLSLNDLTDRREAEEALRRSEHKLTTFFDQAPIGLVWLAADATILRANQAQLDLLGYRADEYLGRSFYDFSKDPSKERELLRRLASNETVRNFPITRRCKDGRLRQVLVDANPFWDDDQLQHCSLFVRDITDRIELERGILLATDREHRRFAQDLHDGLGQLLAGTAYLTSTLRQKLAAKSLPEAGELGRILEVIYEAITQTRNLARGLHPVESEPNGLMAALQTLATRTKILFHVGCRFGCRQPVLIRDNETATHLFRIAQEAITNAIKHGKPRRIEIGLTQVPGRLKLIVKDNGAGLPARQRKKPGMGLRIMRYRAGMIGGSLTIKKTAGGGTTIVCTAPLSGEYVVSPAQKKN